MNIIKALWRDWLYYKYQQSDRMNPTPTETFTQYFDRQGFKHFTAAELTWYFNVSHGNARNSEPPRTIWKNIIPTIKALDRAREILGCPITITSSYRDADYNASCPGAATGSYHQKFMACDVQAATASPRKVWEVLHDLRDQGYFSGGLGLYRTFVHIDCRGYNANWKGSGV
jgi:uncharacterized protein YcbK (DUF882 family)